MSVYFDAAIAVILVFFLLSLVVTATNEVVAVVTNWRGRMLLRTLSTLIDDAEMRDRVLTAALFRTLFRARSSDRNAPPPRRFPDRLPTQAVFEAIVDAYDRRANDLDPDVPMQALVLRARQAAEDTAVAFSEAWDDVMDQVSARYKRNQQYMSVLIGFLMAALLNINVFTLAGAVASDEAVRAFVVRNADDVIRAELLGPDKAMLGEPGDSDATADVIPMSASAGRQPQVGARTDGAASILDAPRDAIRQLRAALAPAGIGWTGGFPAGAGAMAASDWVVAVAAWILAGLASVLGAPFWFDLLNRGRAARGNP